MRTPRAKQAEPMARMVSDWLWPKRARKQTAPMAARMEPMTIISLGMAGRRASCISQIVTGQPPTTNDFRQGERGFVAEALLLTGCELLVREDLRVKYKT